MEIPRQSCDHIGILTKNLDAMKEFYSRVLGFEIGDETTLSTPLVEKIFGLADECRFVKLHKQGFMIELFEPLSERLHKRVTAQAGMNHWGYCVADREIFVKELRREGIGVIEISRNGRSVYFLTDPDGNRIEVRSNAK